MSIVLGSSSAAAAAEYRSAGEPLIMRSRVLRSRGRRLWLAPLAALLLFQVAGAQTRFTYSKGQSVSPAYEGSMPNEEGSFTMYFGYMNTNWLQEFCVPNRTDHAHQPGGADPEKP